MLAFCTKAFPQYWQAYFLSSKWMASCLVTPPLVANSLPHTVQLSLRAGFSCFRMWQCRLRFSTTLSQISHLVFWIEQTGEKASLTKNKGTFKGKVCLTAGLVPLFRPFSPCIFPWIPWMLFSWVLRVDLEMKASPQ